MKHLSDEDIRKIKIYSISGIIVVTFILIFTHMSVVIATINSLISILAPFLYGFLMALCLLPLEKLYEYRLLEKVKLKASHKRMIATLLTFISFIIIIIAMFMIVIPQIVSSASNITVYFEQTQEFILDLFANDQSIQNSLESVLEQIDAMISDLVSMLSTALPTIISYGYSAVQTIINLIVGVIVAYFYILNREYFSRICKKMLYAYIPQKVSDWVVYFVRLNGQMFNSFITGKLLDSLIIGILTFIVMSIFDLDYAPLCAVIVGITNVIPYFGPIFGAIPCAILLLLVEPIQCLKFVIIILCVQQFDGNILGPYILGDSVKLQAFWILFAILIFGGLFGFVGMFLGVPVFAAIYAVVQQLVNDRLAMKQIEIK